MKSTVRGNVTTLNNQYLNCQATKRKPTLVARQHITMTILNIENYFTALLPANVDLLAEKPSILHVHK